MRRITLIILFGTMLAATSCKKNADDIIAPEVPASNELKASANFNWKTYRNVSVSVTGTPVTGTVTGKFVIELENGQKVYEALHDMKQNYNFTLQLPAHTGKLIYKFGTSLTKEVSVTGSTIQMNYLVDTDNGYNP
jgi:hypothetical protein